MAVTTSTRMGLTRWSAGTDPFTRAQMDASMAALEAKALIHLPSLAADRPAAGTAGRFHYATDTAAITYDNGTAWSAAVVLTNDARLSDARTPTAHVHAAGDTTTGTFAVARIGSGTASTGKYVDGGTGAWTSLPAAVNSLAGLSDVTITAAATGEVLRYDGTKWVDAALVKADVGLGNVENTADLDKPISSATATELGTKVPVTRSVITGAGLTGGGTLAADRTLAVAYGTTATTACVGNDTRLADARVPLTHGHAATDVTSGVFAVARIPGHTHAQADVTNLTADLAAKATKAGGNTFTETQVFADRVEVGDANTDVELVKALRVEADTRNLVLAYTGADLTSIKERNGTTDLNAATIAYSDGKVSTVTEVVDGKTITTTLTYTGDNLTSVTRSVA